MVKRKCTKKQLAALARGRAIRKSKMMKKTKATLIATPVEEFIKDGRVHKIINVSRPEDKEEKETPYPPPTYDKQEKGISYPPPTYDKQEKETPNPPPTYKRQEKETSYPIVLYNKQNVKKENVKKENLKKEKLNIKNGLELGNYLSKKFLEAFNKTQNEDILKNEDINKIRSEIRNWEKITNEKTKTVIYNGEKIEIPLSLLPDDKTFLEKHGEVIKNAFVSTLALSILGYGGYHGYKFFKKYILPFLLSVASTIEATTETGGKVVDKAGNIIGGAVKHTKNIGKTIGKAAKGVKNFNLKKALRGMKDETREFLTRLLID